MARPSSFPSKRLERLRHAYPPPSHERSTNKIPPPTYSNLFLAPFHSVCTPGFE